MQAPDAALILLGNDITGSRCESARSLTPNLTIHQISSSKAKLPSYHYFPCLFGGLWYQMNPYRGHTVLVHMSCYHTSPFPRAPTGRICSQGATCQVSQLPYGKEKMQCGQKRTVNLGKVCPMFMSLS